MLTDEQQTAALASSDAALVDEVFTVVDDNDLLLLATHAARKIETDKPETIIDEAHAADEQGLFSFLEINQYGDFGAVKGKVSLGPHR